MKNNENSNDPKLSYDGAVASEEQKQGEPVVSSSAVLGVIPVITIERQRGPGTYSKTSLGVDIPDNMLHLRDEIWEVAGPSPELSELGLKAWHAGYKGHNEMLPEGVAETLR